MRAGMAVLLAVVLVSGGLALADNFVVHTPLDSITITSPDDEEEKTWCADSQHTVVCTESADDDCNTDTGQVVADSVSHWWTAASGTFPSGNIGTSVDYTCAATGGLQVGITAHADDDYAPASNTYLADDSEVSDTVEVTVLDTVVIAELKAFHINQTDIQVSATVTAGGSPVSGVTVSFSSTALTFPGGSSASTDGSGVATVTATAGANPSSAKDADSVTADAQCEFGGITDDENFTIARLQELTVANAVQEAGKATHFVTITGAGNVVITAVLTPSLQAADLPEDFVTWTNGTQGDDQLHRNVSRGAATNVEVTATCGPDQRQVTIHVVATQAPGANAAATLTDSSGAALAVDPFGEMNGSRAVCGDPDPDFVARLDGNQWVLRLNSVSHVHRTGTNSGGNTDISGAYDSDVTAGNHDAVIADLTPPAPGTASGPPRDTYWSQSITQSHEDFHATDFHSNYWTPRMQEFETWVETHADNRINFDCNDPNTMTEQAVHDSREAAVQARCNQEHDTAWANILAALPAPEVAAHNHSNPMYQTLCTEIHNRFHP